MKPGSLEGQLAKLNGDEKDALIRSLAETDEEMVAAHLEHLRGEFGDTALAKVDVATLPSASERTGTEVAPEQAWLREFKARFDALPELHKGVQWADVVKTLKANPDAEGKLKTLDENGFEMNVFGEKNGEIVFRTAQTDVTQIAAKYRTIMYDQKAQTDYPEYQVNGNAEEIAASMGVELADRELYEQFRIQNGWVWLKTDAATRKAGYAFDGLNLGVFQYYANDHNVYGSFCAALRVKKLSV